MKTTTVFLVIIAISVALLGVFWLVTRSTTPAATPQPPTAPSPSPGTGPSPGPPPTHSLLRATYSPMHIKDNNTVTEAEIIADLTQLRDEPIGGETFGGIRTYFSTVNYIDPFYPADNHIDLVGLVPNLKLSIGLPLKSYQEPVLENYYNRTVKNNPKVTSANVEFFIVGNELNVGDPAIMATLQTYLGKGYTDLTQKGIHVTTCQTSDFWLDHTNTTVQGVADLCHQYIMVNIYPKWEWYPAEPLMATQPYKVGTSTLMTPLEGFEEVKNTYEQIVALYPTKTVVIGETGWPTTLEKITNTTQTYTEDPLGVANMNAFFVEIEAWALAQKIIWFRFSGYDDVNPLPPKTAFDQHFGKFKILAPPNGASTLKM